MVCRRTGFPGRHRITGGLSGTARKPGQLCSRIRQSVRKPPSPPHAGPPYMKPDRYAFAVNSVFGFLKLLHVMLLRIDQHYYMLCSPPSPSASSQATAEGRRRAAGAGNTTGGFWTVSRFYDAARKCGLLWPPLRGGHNIPGFRALSRGQHARLSDTLPCSGHSAGQENVQILLPGDT